jgi:localization factor PodJL
MAARHAEPDSGRLDEQIRDLARRVEGFGRRDNETASLARLEAQMAEIANALAGAGAQGGNLRQVEQRIDRLQALLDDTHQISIEAARNEARDTVAELSRVAAGNQAESNLIASLMHDIETLRETAGNSEQRMRVKLDSVTQSLAQVAGRLGQLEQAADQEPAQATGTYGPDPLAAAWKAAFQTDDDHGRRLAEFRADDASHAPEDELWSADDAAPLEKTPTDQRADFIAAARRAVQAAALASEESDGEDGDDKQRLPGAFSRLSHAIRNRKRTLLLTAAAVLLAVAAVRIYGGLTTNSDGPVVATAATETVPAPPAPRDVMSEAKAAPVPTVPQVTEPALVAPSPDTAIAFAAPLFGTHLVGGQQGTTGDAPANDMATDDTETGSIRLASAIAAVPAAGDNAVLASDLPVPDQGIGSARLIDAAVDGNPAAAFEVASRYAAGERLPQDLAKAAVWYERAADGGIDVAQYRLASLYERGRGVRKDLDKAVGWYRRAAGAGNVSAMHNLAVILGGGLDGQPDQADALRWFRTAADYGVRDSQYNLGVMYARGLGTGQDLVAAYKWFAIAAAGGDEDAAERRDQIAAALAPDDLAAAKVEVQAWHAQAPDAGANAVAAPEGGWDAASDSITAADRQALVMRIQTLLAAQGYDPGPADGIAGPKTVDAVKQFQRQLGAPQTGQIDNTLVALLSN